MSKYNLAKKLKHYERALDVVGGLEVIGLSAQYANWDGERARIQYFCQESDELRHVCRNCSYSIIYRRPDTGIWACEMCEYTSFNTSNSRSKTLAVFKFMLAEPDPR